MRNIFGSLICITSLDYVTSDHQFAKPNGHFPSSSFLTVQQNLIEVIISSSLRHFLHLTSLSPKTLIFRYWQLLLGLLYRILFLSLFPNAGVPKTQSLDLFYSVPIVILYMFTSNSTALNTVNHRVMPAAVANP